jgi:glycosyltransferase involved in cell wall biosynthesis
MLLWGPCAPDARVEKEARALVRAGYRGRIYCTAMKGLPDQEVKQGVEYVRLPLIFPWPVRLVRWIARRVASESLTVAGVMGGGKQGLLCGALASVLALLKELYRYAAVVLAPGVFRRSFQRQVEDWAPDVVHAHDLVTLLAGAGVAERTGAALVYDAHELEQDRNPPLPLPVRQWIRRLEHRLGSRANLVVTVSEPIAEILASELRRPVILVHNTPVIEASASGPGIREDLGLSNDVPLILYVGGLLPNRGLEHLILALPYLNGFHLAMVGPGAEASRRALQDLALSVGVQDRLHVLPPVDPTAVVPFISTADVGAYAIENVCRSYDFSMPNKLFEMSFAGLPVAVSDLSAARHFLERFGHGRVFSSNAPEDVARTIWSVYQDRDELRLSEEKMSAMKSEFGWPAQADALIRAYAQLPAGGDGLAEGRG